MYAQSIKGSYAKNGIGSEYASLWDSLIAAYPYGMQAYGGNRVYDLSGNGHHGDYINGFSWLPGKVGAARGFTGASSQWVDVPSLAGTFASKSIFSIAALVYNNSGDVSDDEAIFNINTSTTSIFRLDFDPASGANTEIRLVNHDGGAIILTTGNQPDYGQRWLSVVATYDAISDVRNLYIDGYLIATSTDAIGPLSDNDDNVRMGRGHDTSLGYLDGRLEYVYLYDRVLTSSEVQILYDIPYAPFIKRRRIYGFQAAAASTFPPNSLALTGVGR